MRKFLSILLSLIMVLAMIPMTTGVAWADSGQQLGTVDEPWYIGASTPSDIKAWLVENTPTTDPKTYTLHIEGTGEMLNLTVSSGYSNTIPWKDFVGSIVNVQVGNEVTSIGNNAFNGFSNLTSITIPASVTSIGSYAFQLCSNLTTVSFTNILQSKITTIGDDAFVNCSKLENITIPESVTSIGNSAFSKCSSITNINIPANVNFIGTSAFQECKSLTSITIPSGVTVIENFTFNTCESLASIEILGSVTSIGTGAFNGCKSLTSIEIPESVTFIGNGAFLNCSSLTNITIPASVTSIGQSAFQNCSNLTTVSFTNISQSKITTIGENAFNGCSELESITIPASVTNIGKLAFSDCASLATVTSLAATPPMLGDDVFKGCASPTTFVPLGKAFDYIASWTDYPGNIVVKVADVLATVDGGFPTSEENGWINENGWRAYISGRFYINGSYEVDYDLLATVEKSDNNTYEYGDFIFHMDSSNKLENFYINTGSWKGTYAKPVTVSFDMNGNGTPIPEKVVPCGWTVTKPDTPTATNYTFDKWYSDASCTNAWNFETATVTSNTTLYAKWIEKEPESKPTGGGGAYFNYDDYKAILEQAQKQQAELDAKKAEEEKLAEHEKLVEEAKVALADTKFKATSTKQTKLNGKKAIKLNWEVVGGTYSLSDFEGFDVFRSTKRYSGYGKTPFFTTTKWNYTNNKNLKAGKTYYYKVRAFKMVDGEKVYTGWSTKAWRTVK